MLIWALWDPWGLESWGFRAFHFQLSASTDQQRISLGKIGIFEFLGPKNTILCTNCSCCDANSGGGGTNGVPIPTQHSSPPLPAALPDRYTHSPPILSSSIPIHTSPSPPPSPPHNHRFPRLKMQLLGNGNGISPYLFWILDGEGMIIHSRGSAD